MPARCADFVGAAEAAHAGGLLGLVLREGQLEDGALLQLARRLRQVFASGTGFFAVHDRVHVALVSKADGVHLGWRSLSSGDARHAVERARTKHPLSISVSTHAGDTAQGYGAADWVLHGPVGAVPDKAVPLAPIGFEGLAHFVAHNAVPTFALGGLGPGDGPNCRAAGARGMAVRRALWQSPLGPQAAARALVRAWGDV